jgi:para-aminobenzoate synthetase component 1
VSITSDADVWLGPGFGLEDEGAYGLTEVRTLEELTLSPETEPGEVRAILDAADAAVRELAANERLLLLLGYDASCLLAGLAHHRAGGALGPDVWLGVGRVTEGAAPAGENSELELVVPTTQGAHEEAIRACLEAIYDGVCYQANLAHPLLIPQMGPSEARAWFWGRLGRATPAYAALVPLPGFGDLLSLSPERFLRFDLGEGWARAYPVKGTAPRGATPEEDEANARGLERSEKDRAEHVMIVDLLRNDLGRVSTRVTVEALCERLTVSNVFHLESTVRGDLEPGVGLADLLAATAPGGSITGAPKSSACDMIADLEGRPRGPYTGTLVVVDGRGRGASSILIRTWIRPDEGPGALHVGGGIVADSDPAAEWEETLAKARAFGEPEPWS